MSTLETPVASATLVFPPEAWGDPLALFPSLVMGGTPYNRWLSAEILEPALARWSRSFDTEAAPRASVQDDFASASARARDAFARIVPVAIGVGEPAILAALGVTANLQRTLATLGEFLLATEAPAGPVVFRCSRLWCGLIDYRADAPYFSGRPTPPNPALKLRANRRDSAHLRHALWCSGREVESRCLEAVDNLRREVRRGGLSGE